MQIGGPAPTLQTVHTVGCLHKGQDHTFASFIVFVGPVRTALFSLKLFPGLVLRIFFS